MGKRLEGKVAVVTGSGQGVGKEIAVAMAKEGASIVTNNRQPGSTGASAYGDDFLNTLSKKHREWMLNLDARLSGDAETTAREISKLGGQAVPFYGDVSSFEVARRLVRTAADSFGRVDILVNCAGAFGHGLIWEMTEELWDMVVDSHLKGTFNCVRHASAVMKEQKWGRIINTSSGAWLGAMDHSNYSAAKAGIVGLTRSVARDVFSYGITCNAFVPAAMTRSLYNAIVRARMMAEAGTPIMSKEALDSIESRPGAEFLAPFIVYLATDEAADISGTVFALRGSMIGVYSEPEVKKTISKEGLWTLDELAKSVPEELLKGYKSPAAVKYKGI